MNSNITEKSAKVKENPTYHFDPAMVLKALPQELKQFNSWVLWKYETTEKGKPTKVPYSINGYRASTTKPESWNTFDNTVKSCVNGYSGIGIVLNDNLVGLDIDHCLDENGNYNAMAKEVLDLFKGTYAEVSPSGTGLRIFCYGEIHRPGKGTDEKSIEIYNKTSPRYLTVTGSRINDCGVKECQGALDTLHKKYFSEKQTPKEPPQYREQRAQPSKTDSELIETMFRAKNGSEIRALFNGDISGYSSHSEADMALCNHLAFYTGKDAGRMDAIFRQSGLFRDKWDEKHGKETYGAMTIGKAIAGTVNTYEPKQCRNEKPNMDDPGAAGVIPDDFEEQLQDSMDFSSCSFLDLNDARKKVSVIYNHKNMAILNALRETDFERYNMLITDVSGNFKERGFNLSDFKKAMGSFANRQESERKAAQQQEKAQEQELKLAENSIVLWDGELPEQVRQCQKTLVESEIIFERSGRLVKSFPVKELKQYCKQKNEKDGIKTDKHGTERDENAIILHAIEPDYLRLFLCENMIFYKPKKNKETGGYEYFKANCPKDIATTLISNIGAWGVPYLSGIIETPIILTDGRIIKSDGYDPDTCLLKKSDIACDVRDNPMSNDVEHAEKLIHEMLREFIFETPVDYSVAFAAILTAVVRRAVPTAPAFAFDAPCAGTGKTMLAKCISYISTGREPAMISIPPFDDKETEKRFDSLLIAGDPVILIDNIESQLKSERLCAILTSPAVTSRILGMSKTVNSPSNQLWLMTGNNIMIVGDLCRRVLKCRINAGVEKPEERKFDKKLMQWTVDNRESLVNAAITILKAYINSNQKPEMTEYGSFEAWSDFVRGACVWLGLDDPCKSKEFIQAEDTDRAQLANLLSTWYKIYGSNPLTIYDAVPKRFGNDGLSAEDIAEFNRAMMAVAGNDKGEISNDKLGCFIRKNAGRIAEGLVFVKNGKYRNTTKWSVICNTQVHTQNDVDFTKKTTQGVDLCGLALNAGNFENGKKKIFLKEDENKKEKSFKNENKKDNSIGEVHTSPHTEDNRQKTQQKTSVDLQSKPEKKVDGSLKNETTLTPEAEALLKTVEVGLPLTVTRNLARIARDNGVEPAPGDTTLEEANRIIALLREKKVKPAQPQCLTCGHYNSVHKYCEQMQGGYLAAWDKCRGSYFQPLSN